MRGPHDHEIQDPENKKDHPKRRRDEFLRERFPGGVPPTSDHSTEDTPEPADQGRERVEQGEEHS